VKTARQVALAVACCAVVLAIVIAILSMRYAAGRLESIRSSPGYASAETAMHDLMIRNDQAARIEIVGAGNDGPGLRYVVARVWPPRVPGGPEPNPREVGCYFLRMEHGWVHLPADEINGPVVAVGKLLLDHLPWNERQHSERGKGAS